MSIKFTISNLRLPVALLFLLLTLNPVFAGNMYNGVKILIGVVQEKQGMETKIYTLINNLLVFEFERYGFVIEKIKFEPDDSLELILSEDSGTGLAAICSYTTIGTRVLLDLELYDSRTMVPLASASTGADLDLAFDKVISSLVSEIVSEADEELTKRVVNIDYIDYIEISTDVEEDVTEEKTEPELSLSDAGSKGGLEVFLNVGNPMGVGSSSDIFQDPGFSMEIAANYWFFTTFGFFGIGSQVSANLYPSSGPDGTASLIMFPIGGSISWSSSTDRLFSAIAQLGAGPAFAVLVFEGADPLVKVVPYVSGGVFLSFNFRKWMSLGMKTTYRIYFEDTGLLTTLTPSIYASFRSWN